MNLSMSAMDSPERGAGAGGVGEREKGGGIVASKKQERVFFQRRNVHIK